MVDVRQLLDGLAASATPTVGVRDLTDDSHKIEPGALFIARTGPRGDGREHIAEAVRRGAAAIACEAPALPPHRDAAGDVPIVEVERLSERVGEIAERFFGEPARAMRFIGITGSNGKSTVAHLATGLLRSAGVETACVGTLGAEIADERIHTGLTTPGAIELSRLLARARDGGTRACVLETSSHALEQSRVAAINFDVGVFTNLSRDHLDDHGDMETYAGAKAKLFTDLRPDALAIVNTQDPAHRRMLRDCRSRVLRCPGDASVEIERESLVGLSLVLHGSWGIERATPRLIGPYNAMNALQAYAAAHELCKRLGAPNDELAPALSKLGAPDGRLERVGDGNPVVFVDFAHTPAALESTLNALRPFCRGRLVCVFGCGGDRDRGKRPEMGRVVSVLANVAVVTSDNPRTEDPRVIINEVIEGMTGGAERVIEPDRAAAIHASIFNANPDDVIVIAGKGHEDYQLLPDGEGGVRRIDFDDRAVTREALAKGALA